MTNTLFVQRTPIIIIITINHRSLSRCPRIIITIIFSNSCSNNNSSRMPR